MTVREDLEARIAGYEAHNTIVGDAMAIACRGAMMQMDEEELNRDLYADSYAEDVDLFKRENV